MVYASDVGWYPDDGRRGKDNGVAHLGLTLWGSVKFALLTDYSTVSVRRRSGVDLARRR